MNRDDQMRAPIYDALETFRKKRVVPFDVPGINGEEEIRSWHSSLVSVAWGLM